MRFIHRATNVHAPIAQPAFGGGIAQQVIGQERVQVENRPAIETDLLCGLDQELDGLFVVENHLSIAGILALRHLSRFNQPLGFE